VTSLSTHVLDTERGRPAVGVRVTLLSGSHQQVLASGVTGPDGRIGDLGHGTLADGVYRLVFAVGDYLEADGRSAPFLRTVAIEFHVDASNDHYHIPLLVTPFACTTYRGS
jgi:5-hydroxyisourate hydrolase